MVHWFRSFLGGGGETEGVPQSGLQLGRGGRQMEGVPQTGLQLGRGGGETEGVPQSCLQLWEGEERRKEYPSQVCSWGRGETEGYPRQDRGTSLPLDRTARQVLPPLPPSPSQNRTAGQGVPPHSPADRLHRGRYTSCDHAGGLSCWECGN